MMADYGSLSGTEKAEHARTRREINPMDRRKIFVTIQGGFGEVCEETVPHGFEVEILNFDLLAVDAQAEMEWWSSDLLDYWKDNHKAWGRCGGDCPCKSLSSFRSKRQTAALP